MGRAPYFNCPGIDLSQGSREMLRAVRCVDLVILQQAASTSLSISSRFRLATQATFTSLGEHQYHAADLEGVPRAKLTLS